MAKDRQTGRQVEIAALLGGNGTLNAAGGWEAGMNPDGTVGLPVDFPDGEHTIGDWRVEVRGGRLLRAEKRSGR